MQTQPIDKKLVNELRSEGNSWHEVTRKYNEIMNDEKSQSTLRSNYSRHRLGFMEEQPHDSERYQEVSTYESITEEQLLELHGYDPQLWQVTSSNSTRSKIGTKSNEQEYFINTYSKITVKRKTFELTKDILNELLSNSNLKTKRIEVNISNPNGLLEIPLFDMHFGNNSFKYYQAIQSQIANYIESQEWEQTLFIIGQDLFHNDDFRGRTTSGTPITKEDMSVAWSDAYNFYTPLIELSLEQSKKVNIIYSRGNHDETLGWAFVKLLEDKYPQVSTCSEQAEHKRFLYKEIFLGYTHGDKINDKKVVRNFEALFRLEMAEANRRIIKKGHIHTLKAFDDNGTQVITLGTYNESDEWHTENGFLGNHKSFEIFIYNDRSLKAHVYID